jgi:hypothetical protein
MRVAIAVLAAVCFCNNTTGMLAQSPADAERAKYAVDGLALGARLSSERAAYREYRCSRSEQFQAFTLCQKVRNDRNRRGSYRVFESLLLSQNGEVSYVNRYQEPAFFDASDADEYIERYSREIGESPHVTRIPLRPDHAGGIIALWGRATLEQLDQDTVKMLEDGKGPNKRLLIDLIGNLARSAKEGLPIYGIGGGPGLIWVAGFDQRGRGTLRSLATDASELSSPSSGQAPPGSGRAPQPVQTQLVSENSRKAAEPGQSELQQGVEKPKADLAASGQKIAELETAKTDTKGEFKEPAKAKVAADGIQRRMQPTMDAKPTASLAPSGKQKAHADPRALAWKVFALIAFLISVAVFLVLNRSKMRAARYPI